MSAITNISPNGARAMDTETVNIPAYNLDRFNDEFARLQRRAKKIGATVPTATTAPGKPRKTGRAVDGTPRYIETVDVTVTTEPVAVPGFAFAARIEHTPAGNAVHRVPGFDADIPLHYRSVETSCDHCKTNRRRKDTFLVQDLDTGLFQQIGRNCLADFLGHDPQNVLLNCVYREWIGGLREDEWQDRLPRGEFAVGQSDFLCAAFASARKDGWLSRTAARERYEPATADCAWSAFLPADGKIELERRAFLRDACETFRDEVKAAIDHFRSTLESVERRSDYEQNLYIALAKDCVTKRDAGIVASLYVVWSRHLEREIERRRSNEHVGTVGERTRLTLTLRRLTLHDGDYGTRYIHTFETAAGDTVTWFGSREIEHGCGAGDTFAADWKIKDHGEYKGRKQTIVQRPTKIEKVSVARDRDARRRPRSSRSSRLWLSSRGETAYDTEC